MTSHLIDDPSNKDVGPGQRLSLLKGVKVLDMTTALAGPFATMILGDAGADVLKIEPLGGDQTRTSPPFELGGDSAYFISANRNKRSISLSLRAKEAREILGKLVADTDIIFDNMRMYQRKSLGLTFEDLKKFNPRIVSCSLTGFGSTGPYAARPGYDIVVEAMGGVMSLTGPAGGPSVRAGVPIGDINAGMYAVIGCLEGLEFRNRTGKGTHIDISMLDTQVSLLSYLAQYYFIGGAVASHQGSGHVGNPMYNSFATSDAEIVMNAGHDDKYAAVCQVLGREDLIDDPRFATRKARLEHREELEPILNAEFKKRSTQEIYDAFVEAAIPAGPINTIDQALHDPQIREREMVVKVRHRSGEDFLTVGSAVKSNEAEGGEYFSPPGLGDHTKDVLLGIGYSEKEIADLAEAKIINLGDRPPS